MTDDLYGFLEGDLALIKGTIEQVLHIQMETRESVYLGGNYYFSKLPNGDQFTLQKTAISWPMAGATRSIKR
jgi:hypothetical protein